MARELAVLIGRPMGRLTGRMLAVAVSVTAILSTALALAPIGSADPATSVTGLGAFIVGRDIVPGTYMSSGPASPGGRCTWETKERRAGQDIRTGGSSSTSGPVYARVFAEHNSVVAFVTGGCATWELSG